MYIAINRFKVMKGAESAFEQVWLSRDTHLDRVAGFLEFHLLRGPDRDDHVLYASHTIWASQAAFTAWTQSEHFRAAHRDAGANKPLYLGHPEFEGFDVIQTIEESQCEGSGRLRGDRSPSRSTRACPTAEMSRRCFTPAARTAERFRSARATSSGSRPSGTRRRSVATSSTPTVSSIRANCVFIEREARKVSTRRAFETAIQGGDAGREAIEAEAQRSGLPQARRIGSTSRSESGSRTKP